MPYSATGFQQLPGLTFKKLVILSSFQIVLWNLNFYKKNIMKNWEELILFLFFDSFKKMG